MIENESLKGTPLLFVANKQDVSVIEMKPKKTKNNCDLLIINLID